MIEAALLSQIRARFAHIDTCHFSGSRVFFENAGGTLTLKSVVKTSAHYAAIPDNPGRDNPAGQGLLDVIAKGRTDAARFLGAHGGQVIVGETGTELLFRLIRTCLAALPKGHVCGTTLEHPATRSAASHWANVFGHDHVLVAHDDVSGTVVPEKFQTYVTEKTRVLTLVHTSPVTGMGVQAKQIIAQARAIAPEVFVIIDGIQHACHGGIDVMDLDADAYVISPYKVFSRHGYGLAWLSDRILSLPHEMLLDGPPLNWELGTRDTGAYATFSDVVDYFEWLGAHCSSETLPARACIVAASQAIQQHEALLCEKLLHGVGNLRGIADTPGITVIGGVNNPAREGLVAFAHETLPATKIVAGLNARGIRTHIRKADHYSGNVLNPLGLDAAVRMSVCHYNSEAEVAACLAALAEVLGTTSD